MHFLIATQIKDIAQSLKTHKLQFTLWADPKRKAKRSIKELLERLDSSFL